MTLAHETQLTFDGPGRLAIGPRALLAPLPTCYEHPKDQFQYLHLLILVLLLAF